MILDTDIPRLVVLVSSAHGWGRGIISGVLAYTYKTGPWHVWPMPARAEEFRRFMQESQADGIIAHVNDEAMAETVKNSGIPIVNVADDKVKGFEAPTIRSDDRESTRLAANHFIERGFSNVAFIGPEHRANPVFYAQAFRAAAAEHGLVPTEHFIKAGVGKQAKELVDWLKALPKPVGILCWGHGYARRILDCCLDAGICVPHDIAVLSGNYDELMCHASYPALSGIQLPTHQIGYKAAELIHRMIDGEHVPNKTIYLPPTGIMERMSTDTMAVEDPAMEKVVHYLKDHAYGSISMDDVLKEVPMSRRSLERRFHKGFGRTPMEEVRRLRINKARQLLIETDMQMQEIAEACGYATYNYLARVFKDLAGMSPSHYRQEYRVSK